MKLIHGFDKVGVDLAARAVVPIQLAFKKSVELS